MEVQPVEMASFSTEENPLEADEVCFLGALSSLSGVKSE